MSHHPSVKLALAIALLGSACAQGEGDRCEIDDDCKSGLTCQEIQTVPVRERVCRQPGAISPTTDASPGVTVDVAPIPPDSASTDASPDQASDLPSPDVAPDTTADTAPDLSVDTGPSSSDGASTDGSGTG